jgi:hypothetical protein
VIIVFLGEKKFEHVERKRPRRGLVVEGNPKYHYLALCASADGSRRKGSCWGGRATGKWSNFLC